MDELKDIKPFVEIPDFSLYMVILVGILVILLLVLGVFKVYNYFKYAKKSKEAKAKIKLKNLDFSSSKQAAYTITKYAPLLAKNQFHKELLEELLEVLEKYKYKKEVPLMLDEDREKLGLFLEACDG